jgi:putative addiction module killer protein
LEYVSEEGTSPYAEWFLGLETSVAVKITVMKLRMEQGNLSFVKWFRGIGECRLDWGPGYRIYIGREGDRLILLLGGGTKKSQQKDIDKALALWETYKRRRSHPKKK